MADNCYDWDTNILHFTTKDDITFHLELKGKKTILYGDSGTGKSLLVTILNRFKSDDSWLKPYNTDNILIITSSNLDEIVKSSGKLIIIDKGERVLTDDIIDIINADRGINRYIIMVRKSLGIAVSPNYYGKLVRKNDKRIELEYSYNIAGWN